MKRVTILTAKQARSFAEKTPEKEFGKLSLPNKHRVFEFNEHIESASKNGSYEVEFDYRYTMEGMNSLQGEKYLERLKDYFEVCGFQFSHRVNNWPSNEKPPFYSWLSYCVKISWK
jgi:hypothetical protein